MIPALAGALFVLSWLYALWRPACPLMRMAALTVLVMVLAASFLTNNVDVGRLTPALPLLIVLTAVGADAALRKIQSRGDPALFKKMQYCAAALILFTVAGNVAPAARASSSEPVRKQYANSQYALCRAIAAEPRQYRFVYPHAARECNLGDDLWINPDMTAEIENAPSLPGSLVLIGDVLGLVATVSFCYRCPPPWKSDSEAGTTEA